MRAIACRFSRLYLPGFFFLKKKTKVHPDKVTNVLVQVVSGSVAPNPTTARAVEHRGQRRIHLWVLGSFSLCSLWKCGSPAEPTSFAHFAREGELEFKNLKKGVLKCKKCYDSKNADTFLQQGAKITSCRRMSRHLWRHWDQISISESVLPLLRQLPVILNQTRNIDKTSGSHLQSGLASGLGKLAPCRLVGGRGRTSDEGFMGARRSTGTGSAQWFLFPTHTWEPLLLTWVV